ncbi:hypothetical protein ACTFIW_008771 [Dictyostelium discoideum]
MSTFFNNNDASSSSTSTSNNAFTRFMKEPTFSSNTNSRSQNEDESIFNFPSNFQVNVAPFGTPESISVSSTFDVELISYFAQSAVIAQASLSRVRRKNISKEIYGSEVLLPIKIKYTPKMFDET